MILGTIVTVNPRNLTMICRDEFGKNHAVAVSPNATIRLVSEQVKLSDLKQDDQVELSHDIPVSVIIARRG